MVIIGLLWIAPSSLGDLREDRDQWFVSTLGGVRLDLTRAIFPDDGPVTINMVSLFGRPRLTVPVGTAVEFGGVTLVGKSRASGTPASDRARKWLKVNRTALVGGAVVETASRSGLIGL